MVKTPIDELLAASNPCADWCRAQPETAPCVVCDRPTGIDMDDLHTQQEGRDWRAEGITYQRSCKGCREEAEAMRAFDLRVGVPASLRGATLDSYREDRPEQRKLKAVCRDYLAKGGVLILTGKTGTGKSHMAVAILRELHRRGGRCRYLEHSAAQSFMREAYDHPRLTTEAQAERIAAHSAVVIDECGAHPQANDGEELDRLLFGALYEARRNIVIVSNLTASQLKERLGPRTHSRLNERRTGGMECGWEDFRRRRQEGLL